MSLEEFTRSLTGSGREPVMTITRWYAAAPADVWSAMTEPERLARWLGAVEQVDGDGGVRHRIRFADAPDTPADAQVERCVPHELLVVGWDWQGEEPSRLTLSLAPDGEGTQLTLEHRLGEPDHVVAYGGGWEQCLASLGALFGEAVPGAAYEGEAAGRWDGLAGRPLVLSVDLRATSGEVWRALTTVDGLQAWWWNHWDDVEIDADARPGGAYRFAAPGAGIRVEGTYLEVQPCTHLSFTWRWSDDEGTSADEACDVRLQEMPGGCRLTLRHSGPWTDDTPAASYRQGWEFVFAALSRVLTR